MNMRRDGNKVVYKYNIPCQCQVCTLLYLDMRVKSTFVCNNPRYAGGEFKEL